MAPEQPALTTELHHRARKTYYLRVRYHEQEEHSRPFLDLELVNSEQGEFLLASDALSVSSQN